MKVSTYSPAQDFRPVTLTVTFQTAEELELFQNMIKHDVTVPDALHPAGPKHKKLSDIMAVINESLLGI